MSQPNTDVHVDDDGVETRNPSGSEHQHVWDDRWYPHARGGWVWRKCVLPACHASQRKRILGG